MTSQMQFDLEEFIESVAIPYIFELEPEESIKERTRKNVERYRREERHKKGMTDQTEILDRFNDLDHTLQTTLG